MVNGMVYYWLYHIGLEKKSKDGAEPQLKHVWLLVP